MRNNWAQFVDSVSTWAMDEDGRTTVVVDVKPLKAAVDRVAVSASALERQIDAASRRAACHRERHRG